MSSISVSPLHQAVRRAAVMVATAALTASAMPAAAQSAGPFAKFAGSWSGGGRISFNDGRSERLRCRAQYAVGGAGTQVQLSLRCASDSYNFQLRGEAQSSSGAIMGNWSETTRNIGGTLHGRGSDGRLSVRASSPTFNVGLALSVAGNRQSVTINPEGQGEISGASIQLRRG